MVDPDAPPVKLLNNISMNCGKFVKIASIWLRLGGLATSVGRLDIIVDGVSSGLGRAAARPNTQTATHKTMKNFIFSTFFWHVCENSKLFLLFWKKNFFSHFLAMLIFVHFVWPRSWDFWMKLYLNELVLYQTFKFFSIST